jgi:hypothetical protein
LLAISANPSIFAAGADSMSEYIEDLQMLRLIKAFQKLKAPDTRKAIVEFVEAALKEEEEKKKKGP